MFDYKEGRSFVQKGNGCCPKLLVLGVARHGFFLREGILDYKEGVNSYRRARVAAQSY